MTEMNSSTENKPLPVVGGLVSLLWLVFVIVAFSDTGSSMVAVLVLLYGAVLWGVVWLIRFVIWGFRVRRGKRPAMPARAAWRYWGVEPAAFVLSVALIGSGVLMQARFHLSAFALQGYVEDVQAGRQSTFGFEQAKPRQVGLYTIYETELLPGGMVRIITSSVGMGDNAGFVFSPAGEPPRLGRDYYTHLSGNWWHWYRSW